MSESTDRPATPSAPAWSGQPTAGSDATGATREDDAFPAPPPASPAPPPASPAPPPASPAPPPASPAPPPVSPAPPPAFPAPPEFTVGAATVPSPPPFPAPDPAFAAPDAGYTSTPPYPPEPAVSFGQPYGAQPYPPAPAYPAAGYPVPAQPAYGGYGGYGTMPGAYPVYVAPVKTNGLAIGSMVTSIVGALMLFCYGVGLPLGIAGAVLGHVSRKQIRTREETGDGMALAGIIIGWIVTGIGLIIVAALVWLFAWVTTVTPTTGSLD